MSAKCPTLLFRLKGEILFEGTWLLANIKISPFGRVTGWWNRRAGQRSVTRRRVPRHPAQCALLLHPTARALLMPNDDSARSRLYWVGFHYWADKPDPYFLPHLKISGAHGAFIRAQHPSAFNDAHARLRGTL